MAAVRHLGFVKFEILTVRAVKRPILHQCTKFRKDRSNPCGDIAIFVIFSDGGCRHVEFSKIRNFNGLYVVGSRYASSRRISSKSVKRLQRYSDLTVLKMAAVRHLGFWKFKFLTIWTANRPILHNRAKFREDRSNRCCDIAIFVIFKMATAAILDFQKEGQNKKRKNCGSEGSVSE